MQPLLRDSVLAVLAGQLPDDEGLVPGAGQDHVGVLGVGRDLGHPSELYLQSEFIRFRISIHSKLTHCGPGGYHEVAKSRSLFTAPVFN